MEEHGVLSKHHRAVAKSMHRRVIGVRLEMITDRYSVYVVQEAISPLLSTTTELVASSNTNSSTAM